MKTAAVAFAVCLLSTSCKDRGQDNGKGSDVHSLVAPHEGLPTITRWAPKGSPPHRAILLVHGGGGPELLHNRWMVPYTAALTAAGYDVYMPHYFEKGVVPEIEIARAALTFIAKQPGVAPDRIGAVGFSRGGFIALDAASLDERIKAVVEFYGGMHGDAATKMTRMPPTLILHGDKDPIVKVENAHQLKLLFEAKNITHEMHIYPGEEHGFGGEALTDSARRMVAFLDAHL